MFLFEMLKHAKVMSGPSKTGFRPMGAWTGRVSDEYEKHVKIHANINKQNIAKSMPEKSGAERMEDTAKGEPKEEPKSTEKVKNTFENRRG